MKCIIELNGGESERELNALAALIASLGGRAASTPTIAQTDAPNAPTTSTTGSGAASPAISSAPIFDANDQESDVADAGAPDRDSAGLPWDERIHSESRATIADGTWRKRRNVPQDVYDSVLAELTAAGGAVPPPPATTSDTPEPPAQTVAATEPAAAAATSAADDVPPPPADGPDLSNFAMFVQSVMDKDVPPETKTYAALGKLCSEAFNCTALKDMKDKAAQWPMFYDMVG